MKFPLIGGLALASLLATAAPALATPGHLELLNVATGEKTSVANASSWKFSAGSKWLATRLNKAQADATYHGGRS